MTLGALLDNPRQYYGQQVTLVANFGDVLGPRSFTATYDYPLLDQEVPVVSTQQITDSNGRPVNLDEWTTRNVRVIGTVHQFNLAAFEDRLGLDLDDGAWAEFGGHPAIIASQVTLLPDSGQGARDDGSQSSRPRG